MSKFFIAAGIAGVLLFAPARLWAVTDEEFINYSVEFQNAIIQNGGDAAKLKAADEAIKQKYNTGSKEWKAYEAALLKDKPRFDKLMETINEKAAENMMKHIGEEMEKEQ